MSKIKLSKETFDILEAAAKINPSIKLNAGNTIKTISADDCVIMYAVVNDEFPSEAGIYELPSFLNLFKMPALTDAELEFDDQKVTIFGDRTKIQYWFCEDVYQKDTTKVRDLDLPKVKISIDVSQADLASFTRGAHLLDHKQLQFVAKDGRVTMVATAPKLDSANNMEIDLGESDIAEDGTYTLEISNLKLIPGSYQVEINDTHTKWTNKEQNVIFYIVLNAL